MAIRVSPVIESVERCTRKRRELLRLPGRQLLEDALADELDRLLVTGVRNDRRDVLPRLAKLERVCLKCCDYASEIPRSEAHRAEHEALPFHRYLHFFGVRNYVVFSTWGAA
ncbi:MAG: hypothetical protein HYT40_03450 [Candidatus Sungbacteria bacterium]|uniref:Uncharacterized protein n=1 Tax=Candidatus Sungiibacteriota bacterium TaxID=2750080 RepID=A0A931SC42_9BACT|nr:hypothetical protein [Candidatus Sungbacteria bacterium]